MYIYLESIVLLNSTVEVRGYNNCGKQRSMAINYCTRFITYEQHHVVNVENVFQEIDRAAAVVSGSQPGRGTGQPLRAFGHDSSIRSLRFVCWLRGARRRGRRARHLVTDSETTRKYVPGLEDYFSSPKSNSIPFAVISNRLSGAMGWGNWK